MIFVLCLFFDIFKLFVIVVFYNVTVCVVYLGIYFLCSHFLKASVLSIEVSLRNDYYCCTIAVFIGGCAVLSRVSQISMFVGNNDINVFPVAMATIMP